MSLTDKQISALKDAFICAKLSGHLFPDYAACEVMEETGWGTTESFMIGNNPFGEKQTHPPTYLTATLPTWEVIDGVKKEIMAQFIWFPNLEAAFNFRLETLQRLQNEYPHYKAALEAKNGETFIREVSKTWSTDPKRADNILSIYNAHKDLLV